MLSTLLQDAIAVDLPPVRTWGDIGYDYRLEDLQNSEHVGRLRANAATYLYQPYIAQIEGGLDLGLRNTEFDSSSSNGDLVNGHGLLTLFPQSHFPFEAFLEKSDTSTSTDLLGIDLATLRYGVQQRYSSERIGALRLRYEHLNQTQNGDIGPLDLSFRDDTDDVQLNYSRNAGNHQFFADSQITYSDRDDTRGDAHRYFSSLRHNYRPDSTLSVDSRLTRNSTQFDGLSLPIELATTEYNSYMFWRPRTKKRLVLNGSIRAFRFENLSGDNDRTTDTVTVNGGTTYEYSPRIRYSSNSTVSFTRTGADDTVSAFSRAGLDYTSTTHSFAGFDYGWNVGGDGASFFDEQGSVQTASTDVGHNLGRTFPLSGSASLRLNAQQSAVALKDTESRSTQSLLHSLSSTVSWFGGPRSVFVALSANDSRTFGGGGRLGDETAQFQMINLQNSIQQKLKSGASLSGNLSVQATRSVSARLTSRAFQFDDTWRPTASANLSFIHPRLFEVPNLRLRSTLQLISDAYLPLLAQPIGPSRREFTVWETRLDYRIGKLEASLVGRYVETDLDNRSLIFVQFRRYFGER